MGKCTGSGDGKDQQMIKFRSKHVCTPSARKFRPHKEKDKVKVVAVERLPIDHVSELKVKERKPIDPTKYVVSDKIPQSSRIATNSEIPRVTISCGGIQMTKKTTLTEQKVSELNQQSVID